MRQRPGSICPLLLLAMSALAGGCETPLECGELLRQAPDRRICVCPNGGEYRDGLCHLDGSAAPLDGMTWGDAGPDDAEAPDAGSCAERTFYRDADGDGFGDRASSTSACEAPDGYVEDDRDCDDDCESCGPEGTEVCDAELKDEDCDGSSNEAEAGCTCVPGSEPVQCGATDVGECRYGTQTCVDGVYGECEGAVLAADETCNGLDDDCDGHTDESVTTTFYRDADGDMYGSPSVTLHACAAPLGYVARGMDCDDSCAACRPGGTEVCDGSRDEDCRDGVDDGCECVAGTSRACEGGFSAGECRRGTQMCSSAGTWAPCSGRVDPIAERCNGRDDDCNGAADDGSAAMSCGTASRATLGCSAGSCVVTSCTSGYRDCDSVSTNGCETRLGTANHCLACNDVCGWACAESGCNDGVVVDGGHFHTCVLREAGDVACWGADSAGQLGNDLATATQTAPAAVSALGAVTSIVAGYQHTCALVAGGTVYCWGLDRSGQLGDDTVASDRAVPVVVSGLPNAIAIAAGGDHTCALLSSGTVRCWGDDTYGQLGNDSANTRQFSPVPVAGLSGVTAIATGYAHTCALLSNRTVRCWGHDELGQLGNDALLSNRPTPVAVAGLADVVALAAGASHTCALLASGAVRCWGADDTGQLGNDVARAHQAVPVAVQGLTGVAALALGSNHSCALMSNGRAQCWGSDHYGQLGNDSDELDQAMPVAVLDLGDIRSLGAGGNHTCAVLESGAVRCWGSNYVSQLGNGGTRDEATSVPTLAPGT
ncbi:RCC1 domain-containing protein [Sandaracinus amylolyticus]|uniref:RCC1 domain-containing protein n=1 Tax=Sandaracinus amylolyticus TaxID=927083 RepID=UPI001F3DDBFE|nr:MopE-related protein [Sandaracinus amylolyticus]UJR79868.1 Hypothetical protein I5071_19080 [Sandaracinus amylolyticus]